MISEENNEKSNGPSSIPLNPLFIIGYNTDNQFLSNNDFLNQNILDETLINREHREESQINLYNIGEELNIYPNPEVDAINQNLENINSLQIQENNQNFPNKEQSSNPRSNRNNSISHPSSNRNTRHTTRKIIGYKTEPYIQFFKKEIGKWIIQKLKKFKLYKMKFYLFDRKGFTAVSAVGKNKKFLKMKISELLTITSKPGNRNNIEVVKKIYSLKKKLENKNLNSLQNKRQQKINSLFNILEKTYEELIIEFTHSEDFQKFKQDPKVIKFEKDFKSREKKSLIGENDFIEFIKRTRANKKKGVDLF